MLGKSITVADYIELKLKPSLVTIQRYFGSWRNAIEESKKINEPDETNK